jgi:hypothetical protein
MMDDEQAELRDTVPETPKKEEIKLGLTKRGSTFSRRNEAAKEKKIPTDEEEIERLKQAEDEQLPRPLQRVRTRRLEEMNVRLVKSRSKEADTKKNGKRADKAAWRA